MFKGAIVYTNTKRNYGSSAKLCVLAITLGEVGFVATNLAHLNAIVSTSGPHPLGEDGHRKTTLAQKRHTPRPNTPWTRSTG